MLLALGSIALVKVTNDPRPVIAGGGVFCIVGLFRLFFFLKNILHFVLRAVFNFCLFLACYLVSYKSKCISCFERLFYTMQVQNDIFQFKWLYLKPDRYILKTRYGKLPVLFFEDIYIFIMAISMISTTAGKYVVCVSLVWLFHISYFHNFHI